MADPKPKPDAKAPAPKPPAAPRYRQRVRATQDGFIYEARRRIGDVFTITDPKHFSKTWMEEVDDATPEKITTGGQALRQQHDDTQASRFAEKTGTKLPTGAGNPLDGDDDE